eukprot:7382559-Prymnesium_polylepis.1
MAIAASLCFGTSERESFTLPFFTTKASSRTPPCMLVLPRLRWAETVAAACRTRRFQHHRSVVGFDGWPCGAVWGATRRYSGATPPRRVPRIGVGG